MTPEAVISQVLALAAQGVPLKAMVRTTGLSRQTTSSHKHFDS